MAASGIGTSAAAGAGISNGNHSNNHVHSQHSVGESSTSSSASRSSMSSAGGRDDDAGLVQSVASYSGAAPTPFNTLWDEYAYDDVEVSRGSVDHDGDVQSYASQSHEAVVYNPTAFTPADTIDQSQWMTDTSNAPSRMASHTTSTYDDSYIPASTRPVPAPPQVYSVVSNQTGGDLSPIQSVGLDSLGTVPLDEPPKRIMSRFRRKPPPTQVDRDTMRLRQLGYDAVLGRNYNFWASLGIAYANIGTIQGTIFGLPTTYKYGGPTMMLVAWPVSGVLSMCLVSSLAELASAYPVAGAMASWSWKCARGGIGGERYWGWVMGAIVLGGHVGNLILLTWQVVRIIVGTMALALVDYEEQRWQMVLFYFAFVIIVGSVGSTGFGAGPRYWIGAGIFGVCAWLALCIALLATGVRNRDFSQGGAISTKFFNGSGWSSHGLVYILGWQYCTIATGADVAAHMSEETQNPSRNVPLAMVGSVGLTYILAYISIIILLISVNPNDALFLAGQAFPAGHILAKAVSLHGAIAFCVIILITMSFQAQAQLQAASRFVFALARDRALPFSDQIKRTNSAKQPWIATWIVVALWMPCGCLLAGQAGVIYSVATTAASTLSMLSYLIPVFLYLVSKKNLQSEGRSSWSLRRWSRPVACVSCFFCLTIVAIQTVPSSYPVTPQSVSWSPVVIVCTLLISFCTWKLYGDSHYSGPIRALTKWETGVEIDLDTTLHSTRGAGAALSDPSATSLKLAVTPCYDDTTVHTVQVASARTVDSTASMGEWAQASFTTSEDATHSGSGTTSSGGSTASPRDFSREIARSRSATQTMGRVSEVAEEEEVEVGAGSGGEANRAARVEDQKEVDGRDDA